MVFRTNCRRASELLTPPYICLEKASQHPSRLGRQYSSCPGAPQSPSSSLLSASSSSSSSPPRRLHRCCLERHCQFQQQTRSKTGLARSTHSPRNQLSRPPSLQAPFSSSSTISFTDDASIGSSLTPQATTEEVRTWFEEHYGELRLPDAMLLQFITHESWDNGTGLTGHNRRLSFLGRRAMNMFMSLFLHLNVAGTSAEGGVHGSVARLLSASEEVDSVLQTSRLGDGVGRALRLEEVMRWQPAVSDGQVGPKETGLFKIRGVTVEAFVGAVYHQHGAAVARAFFDSRILPQLESLPVDVRETLGPAIEAAAAAGRSVLAALPQQQQRQNESSAKHTGRVSSRVSAVNSSLADGSSQRREHAAAV